MTFSERMVAGSLGVMLLIVGGRVAWLVGAEAFSAALGAFLMVLLGALCVYGAITLGADR